MRYRWEPDAGSASIADDAIATTAPGYLAAELEERLDAGPASFTLVLQLAEDGDDPTDPTLAWPAERETVTAGHLVLDTFAGQECDA